MNRCRITALLVLWTILFAAALQVQPGGPSSDLNARAVAAGASSASPLGSGNVLTKDLTEEDHRRLNGGVERIIQKGATSQSEVLDLVRSLM
jgi:hypothetical protein